MIALERNADGFRPQGKEVILMEQKKVGLKANLMFALGAVFGVLGLAFWIGSGLAYLQGMIGQIAVLTMVGLVCLVLGGACLWNGHRARKRVRQGQ